MNYIKKLQEENAALKAELAAKREVLIDLEKYLLSDKFRGEDTTVQARDVLYRLEAVKTAF